MHTYLDAMQQVMEKGTDRPNRTGIATRSLFGMQTRYDLTKGFPAVTTKKLAMKAIIGELIGFIRGIDNAADFRALGCGVWDANAAAPYWQSNPHCRGEDDLGRIYGVQWRSWKSHTPILDEDFKVRGYEPFDQLADVIERIKHDPYDRRLIVNAWNAWEIADEQMALPPCHVMFQFYADPVSGLLDMQMYQRSADMFLGVPFNIASYSLLLHMVAQVTGYKAGEFIHTIGDAHIYHNHFDQVKEQLSRKPLPLPVLRVTKRQHIDDFTVDDFELEGYLSHPALKAPMAV